ncbi:MAG TPA: hypothetical protein VMR08_04350 [Patescibacteria group bacterium]|jgi:hypothetical protein|nr:hypothetical protein [Patescibacteria group bacterium]
MTAANHVLAGSAIALAIHQPALALPLAFASHFVLDALPHFGYAPRGFAYALRQRRFMVMEVLDLVGLIILVFTINFTVWTTFAAAVLAVSPDFEWLSRYFYFWHKGKPYVSSFFGKFHAKIQWCERPWGIYAEITFFIVGYFVVSRYLLH